MAPRCIIKTTPNNLIESRVYGFGQIVELPFSELHPPEFHPFQVNDDVAMARLVKSVKQYGGIRKPGLARPPLMSLEIICVLFVQIYCIVLV